MTTSSVLARYSIFNDKSFLIVDDFQEFRTAIKRMVESFGAVDIETSSNGIDAMTQIMNKNFDVILCDYNLGDGKDGQQILEEGKYSGAINESQIFVMITAENNADMVMGALEYEPDGYLIKPFTKEMVYERLIKCIAKKNALMEIYHALAGANPEEAIKICDKIISSGGKYVLPCIKIKGRELMQLGRYQEALNIYARLLEARNLSWALLAIGKCYYHLGDLDSAKQQFELLLQQNASCVEALDWIAKIYVTTDDKIKAQQTLEQSITLSSKAILRQQSLADLAYDNADFVVALKAYKAAVELGKHSCYRRDKDFYRYATLLYNQADVETNNAIQARYEQEAAAVIQIVLQYNMQHHKDLLEPYIFLLTRQVTRTRLDEAHKTVNKINGVLNLNDKKSLAAQQVQLQQLCELLTSVTDEFLNQTANNIIQAME